MTLDKGVREKQIANARIHDKDFLSSLRSPPASPTKKSKGSESDDAGDMPAVFDRLTNPKSCVERVGPPALGLGR